MSTSGYTGGEQPGGFYGDKDGDCTSKKCPGYSGYRAELTAFRALREEIGCYRRLSPTAGMREEIGPVGSMVRHTASTYGGTRTLWYVARLNLGAGASAASFSTSSIERFKYGVGRSPAPLEQQTAIWQQRVPWSVLSADAGIGHKR